MSSSNKWDDYGSAEQQAKIRFMEYIYKLDFDEAISLGFQTLFNAFKEGKVPVYKQSLTEEILAEDGEFHPLQVHVGWRDNQEMYGHPSGAIIAVNNLNVLAKVKRIGADMNTKYTFAPV